MTRIVFAKWLLILSNLADVLIVDNKHDLNVYNDIQRDDAKSTSCCGPRPASDPLAEFKTQSRGIDFNEWAGGWRSERGCLRSESC